MFLVRKQTFFHQKKKEKQKNKLHVFCVNEKDLIENLENANIMQKHTKFFRTKQK